MVDFYQRGVTGFEQGRQRAARNRLNELTQIALTSPPELQRGIAAEMARVDATTGQQFAQQARDREMERLRAQAAFMQSASPEVQQRIYGAMRPSLQNLGLDAPEQFTPDLVEPIRGALFNLGASGIPASVQEFNTLAGMARLTPEERAEAAKVSLGLRGRAPSAGFQWRTEQIGDQKILVRNNPMTGETEYAQIGANGMPQPIAPQGSQVQISPTGEAEMPDAATMQQIMQGIQSGQPFTVPAGGAVRPVAQPRVLGTNTVDLAARTAGAQEAARIQAELAAAPARAAAAEERAAAEKRGALEGEKAFNAPAVLRAANNNIRSGQRKVSLINEIIDTEIEPQISAWSTGPISQFMSSIGGTDAADLRASIAALRAYGAFSELQSMRDASPTGAALGAVSEKELALLEQAFGDIEQARSPQAFRRAIARYRRQVGESWQNVLTAYEEQFGVPYGQAPAASQQPAAPSGFRIISTTPAGR